MTPEEYFFDYTGGFRLFKGKIADVLRETRGGFNFGKVVLEASAKTRAAMRKSISRMRTVCDGERRNSCHDARPHLPGRHRNVHARAHRRVKYGKRVLVVGLPCYHLWRTEKGIELVGPRYFGLNTDYIPVEERCKG